MFAHKLRTIFFFLFIITFSIQAQKDLSYYLPQSVSYDSKIPTPKQFLGYEIGEWHLSHDLLASYMKHLAKSSDRIMIKTYGRSYENRPLLLMTISSPENLAKIDQLREEHVQLTDPENSEKLNIENMPSFIWLGYSVHGNEASGSNASPLVAYYLAAAQGEKIDNILKNTVILLDPSYNPDGLQRFSSWVNMHKSKNLVSDPMSRELNEIWPRGRTNHYWFDLNRDWLPVQHPESKGRIDQFHIWKPNILTDHHEMGTNSTFFFQPGIPSRKNPLTPNKNVLLTEKIAEYHAKALDSIGSSYYSEESFDDFYYGKGSSYPDVQGAVGILFEQASSRGHAQQSVNGVLTFPFAIKNHFTTSLSTIEAAQYLRKDLLSFQREFFSNAIKEAEKNTLKAYVFGDQKDKIRNFHFIEMLLKHKIKVYKLNKAQNFEGESFNQETGYIVPINQPQSKLIQSIFRKQTSFNDSLFYDVSAWTMPLAFGIPYAEAKGKAFNSGLLGTLIEKAVLPEGKLVGKKTNVAYAFEWFNYNSPKLLYAILNKGIKAKVATKKTVYKINNGDQREFSYGSIIIPVGIQKLGEDRLYNILSDLAKENSINIYGLETGLSKESVEVGSPSLRAIKKPNVLIVGGEGSSSYEVGEVWHLLDQRYNISATLIDQSSLHNANLEKYSAIILVNGNYSNITGNAINNLKTWVRKNGTLILTKGGVKWGSQNGFNKIKFKTLTKLDSSKTFSYEKLNSTLGAKQIGGAIFESYLDISHPIGYGYSRNNISVFRNSRNFAEKHKNPFANPLFYVDKPLQSGYISADNLDMVSNSAGIIINAYGRGKVISMIDNPNFRAFWYGTNKLFANAIFFGNIISSRSAR